MKAHITRMHARKRRQKYYAQLDARSRARAGGSNPKILLSELETFKSLCGGEGGEVGRGRMKRRRRGEGVDQQLPYMGISL